LAAGMRGLCVNTQGVTQMTFHETKDVHQRARGAFEHNNRVLSFRQWCELNGISARTGRRILKSDSGPIITQLSPRRIGITLAHNAEWLARCAR
jgi:hypothetical protein